MRELLTYLLMRIMRRFFFTFAVSLCVGLSSFAQSYIVVDNQTGHILSEQGRNDKRQIASLTKVAAALVVLDWADVTNSDLSARVIVPPEALQTGGVNPVGLQPGDEISLRDLLYCSLMASDNSAAYTLAREVGARLPNPKRLEPADNFVAHMNALARTLGMKRTRYLNPHGLDSREGSLPFSTAADQARLTRYAYTRPGFQFYVSQASREIHLSRLGQEVTIPLQNTNTLLGQWEIDGVKTGRTARAGDCVILSSDKPPLSTRQADGKVLITPRRIIVVLLGSQDRFGQGLALIQRGWAEYDRWAASGWTSRKNETL